MCVDVSCVDVSCVDVSCVDVSCVDVSCVDVTCVLTWLCLTVCYVLCSYKEESEAATESDELIEMEASQSQDCSNNDAETIEAVLYSRVGKKGGKMMVLLMF